MRRHGSGAGGLAEDHHVGRVAVERRDVLLDPLEGEALVLDAVVARAFVGVRVA